MIKPLSGKVYIQVEDETELRKEGGLWIGKENVDDHAHIQLGKVVAVGDFVNEVCVGDKVMVKRYSGTYVNEEGVIVVNEGEILAAFEQV